MNGIVGGTLKERIIAAKQILGLNESNAVIEQLGGRPTMKRICEALEAAVKAKANAPKIITPPKSTVPASIANIQSGKGHSNAAPPAAKKPPREVARELCAQYDKLETVEERRAFFWKNEQALADPAAEVGLVTICMAAGKPLSMRARMALNCRLPSLRIEAKQETASIKPKAGSARERLAAHINTQLETK
jgi:hypothetical protein